MLARLLWLGSDVNTHGESIGTGAGRVVDIGNQRTAQQSGNGSSGSLFVCSDCSIPWGASGATVSASVFN